MGRTVNELHVPTFLAVGLWIASGFAVAGYTLIAFKETATGGSTSIPAGEINPELVAKVPGKPKERGRFNPSKAAKGAKILPGGIGQ